MTLFKDLPHMTQFLFKDKHYIKLEKRVSCCIVYNAMSGKRHQWRTIPPDTPVKVIQESEHVSR